MEVLFPMANEDGKRTMCAIFPTNGLYVAAGLSRYVQEKELPIVDVTEFFNEMKMADYYDLKVTLTLEMNARNVEGREN